MRIPATWRHTIMLAAWMASLVVASGALPYGRAIVALLMLPFALVGPRYATVCLLLLFILRMLNPAVLIQDEQFAAAAWLTTLTASARVWWSAIDRRGSLASKLPPRWGWYFASVVLLASWSSAPSISLMKATTFFFVAGATVLGVRQSFSTREQAAEWLVAMWLIVCVLSMTIVSMPHIGYFRDGQGFQGVLNHPQALAVFLAPLLAYLLGKAGQLGLKNLALVLSLTATTGLILMTRARTGPASIVLALLLLLLLRGNVGQALPALKRALKRPAGWLKMMAALAGFILISPSFSEQAREYLFKSASSDDVGGAFEESRGFIIAQALINIDSHPITGIGFGVSESATHEFTVDLDPLTGLPLSAATEKANLLIAVAEETGLVGSLFFLAFFLPFIRRIARCPDISVAWCAMTGICTNISEMTFFSMGGLGLYTWMLAAWALRPDSTPRIHTAIRPVTAIQHPS